MVSIALSSSMGWGGGNSTELCVGFVQDVADLLADVLDVDKLPVGSHGRICENLSIITFLCFSRASQSKNFIGSPTPSYFFPSTMGGHRGCEVELLIP